MHNLLPSTSVERTPGDHDEVAAVRLETLITRLIARQASGRIGYWAAYNDERGVSRYAFTTDPGYAELSPENAASRSEAVAAFGRAIERYRAVLTEVRAAP